MNISTKTKANNEISNNNIENQGIKNIKDNIFINDYETLQR